MTLYTLLSPAKKQQWDHPFHEEIVVPRRFQEDTAVLVGVLQEKTKEEIASLMGVSAPLAQLNHERYQSFSMDPLEGMGAVFAFQGDVYQSLGACDWDQDTCLYAQEHLGIISGLYGLLRPLDRMQPYRLEMKTRLATPGCRHLYDFWGDRLSCAVNDAVRDGVCINLASVEYSRAVFTDALVVPVVTPAFKQRRGDMLRTIGVMAKRARGAMAAWMMLQRIEDVEEIKAFDQMGYQYEPELSDASRLVFVSDA